VLLDFIQSVSGLHRATGIGWARLLKDYQMPSKLCPELLIVGILLGAANPAAAADSNGEPNCHIGTYRFTQRAEVDIGGGEEGKLRWRRKDGTTGQLTRAGDGSWTSTLGWTDRPDGIRVTFAPCGTDGIWFDGVQGTRVLFDVMETRFAVEDAVLAGRLVMPRGTGRVPIVVLVHGSEHDSARDDYALQRQFPGSGIGAFVYDKRGTGGSSGDYTQDYLVLANDAIAALREAKRLAGDRVGRVGYQGGSQGGWVAPLAARIEPVDFVVVGFGLAVSPLQEDRSAIALDVTRHGYGADVMVKAMEIADASAAILNSNFQEGYDKLDALRARYGTEPWFHDIHGDVTWVLLQQAPQELRVAGPKLFAGVPLHYDPMPVLRNLAVPQLWILGADDADAPSAETARRLRALSAAGHPISVAVFPHAEHGIYEYETTADGARLSTRQPDGYFRLMQDFIFGRALGPAYGTAALMRASVH
jgi:pimeloyl-ACP methyl ester carboxylesterase